MPRNFKNKGYKMRKKPVKNTKTIKTPSKPVPKKRTRGTKKPSLSKANFSRDKKWFNLQSRLVNLSNAYTFEIRLDEAPKAKEGEEQALIEKPFRVIAVMPLMECPCWNFSTAQEAQDFVDQIWKVIK